MQKRLVLFDIDETMISSDGAGRRAISKVLKDRFDIDPQSITLSMSGKTDPQILTEIMSEAGHEGNTIAAAIPSLIEEYLGHLQTEISETKHYIVHDGVPEVLAALAEREGAYLGLLTGNVERGARMKLERFKLNHHFPLGAYGSDSASRLDLPHVAKLRADEHFKLNFAPHEIVVIGDSIFDVLCAKHYGAVSLAVNSGRTTREELEAQNPDYLFSSLADTQSVIQAIFN